MRSIPFRRSAGARGRHEDRARSLIPAQRSRQSEDLARLLPKLRHWACSGEALTAPLAAAFAARLPDAELFNIYGASEFWDATWFAARDQDGRSGVRIGSPIANMRAIVLSADFEPTPINVAGEAHFLQRSDGCSIDCGFMLSARARSAIVAWPSLSRARHDGSLA